MTRFNIEQITEQADTIYVDVDDRFNIAIERTNSGVELRIYPRTEGELWDAPVLQRLRSKNPRSPSGSRPVGACT